MREHVLVAALATAIACTGSFRSPTDGGEDVASDAAKDVFEEASDSTCASQAHDPCGACCVALHPDGYQKGLQYMATCACVNPGGCQTACAAEYCANPPKDSQNGDGCFNCVVNTGCGTTLRNVCMSDPVCKAYLDCGLACP